VFMRKEKFTEIGRTSSVLFKQSARMTNANIYFEFCIELAPEGHMDILKKKIL
ncbi:MAG: hypothetical protein RIQ82_1024, partial [Bacteroidota bacterium]